MDPARSKDRVARAPGVPGNDISTKLPPRLTNQALGSDNNLQQGKILNRSGDLKRDSPPSAPVGITKLGSPSTLPQEFVQRLDRWVNGNGDYSQPCPRNLPPTVSKARPIHRKVQGFSYTGQELFAASEMRRMSKLPVEIRMPKGKIEMKDFEQKPLRVIVGEVEMEFYVQKNIVCRESEFFKTACNKA